MLGLQSKQALLFAGLLALFLLAAYSVLQVTPPRKVIPCIATAYAIEGVTASGEQTRHGIVAVDPSLIPLGSKVRITGAGKYSGVYGAEDTGRNIIGRRIDIYMESWREAKEFGRRKVNVAILEWGGQNG